MNTKPGVIVICGPTASGKTHVAITLCQQLKGRILSADSMQVYRYMDIGTAKPDPKEQELAPHALIDILDPDEAFDAARFAELGRKEIMKNHEEGFITLVTGGTGLYIKALLQGLFRAEPVNAETLSMLEKKSKEEGLAGLYADLEKKDPDAAQKIHPNDAFRIIRALEFFNTMGIPISSMQREHRFSDKPDYAVVKIGLKMDRSELYERINQRVDQMLDQGLEEEVKKLLAMGYGPELKSMQAIGYRHMVAILAGKVDREEGIRLLKRDTRRYAKRQFTWFNADAEILWIEPESLLERLSDIRILLEKGGAKCFSAG